MSSQPEQEQWRTVTLKHLRYQPPRKQGPTRSDKARYDDDALVLLVQALGPDRRLPWSRGHE